MIRLRSREAAVFSQPRERTPLSARMVSHSKLNKLAIFATAAPQFRRPRDSLSTKGWIWKASVAGLCGSVTHTLLMIGKTELGLLESFQPYQSLQIALGDWTGQNIHPLLPWLISYVNGSTAAGFAFAQSISILAGHQRSSEGGHCWRTRLARDGLVFPSIIAHGAVCHVSRPRSGTWAVLARHDAGLQRRDGYGLQHHRCRVHFEGDQAVLQLNSHRTPNSWTLRSP